MADATPSTTNPQKTRKKGGQWSETCIGLWTKSTLFTKNEYKDISVCTGINLIKIKNMEISAVQPTNTVGIQIILQDTDVPNDSNKIPTSSELSVTEQIYTSYENKLPHVKNHWYRFKDNSKSIADAIKTFSYSPNKFEQMNSFVSKEYKDLRNWIENYWK